MVLLIIRMIKLFKYSRYMITILFLILFFQGCYYDNVEELYPGANNCDITNTSFQAVIKPIIDTNCAVSGCHVSGTGRKDLTTYQGIKDVVDDGRLEQHVIIQKDMPPSQPLSICNREALKAWIADGASSN